MLTHEIQPALPASVRLDDYGRIEITGGEEESVRALARAILTGVATLHDPDSVLVAVLAAEDRLPHWEWAKWLPHTQSARAEDRLGAEQ
jgi:S-DNA-T family DNA segregation ATPase FtsK/SpoIIIE